MNENEVVIRLSGVAAYGYHGVYDFEQEKGQNFSADVECVVKRPRLADELETTFNYGALSEQIVKDIEGEKVQLIESLAERIAQSCLAMSEMVEKVTVTVHKPEAPHKVQVGDTTVMIVRTR